MNAPDKLFLHDTKVARPSWHHGRVAEGDVEYIRKDALMEWANKALSIRRDSGNDYFLPAITVLDDLIDKLNEL